MIIKKMTATFGNLQNAGLELNDGMNIIYAPNEGGKSTWCAFIRSMLYGIDSSAREKSGKKPDKVRFAPWNGAPMSGAMEVEYDGNDLTITRSGRAGAPMRDVSVTYSGTSQAAESIGPNVGETMLGVPREVFERSAFIGQGKVAVGSSPELEKRIAAIVQTGDENASYTEADEKLRAAMRKRRYNRAGRLPEIESEIEAKERKLAQIEEEEQRGEALRAAKVRAVEVRDALNEKVALSRKESRREALEKLTSSRNRVRELEGRLSICQKKAAESERALYSDFFGEAPVEECAERVSRDTKKLSELDDELSAGAKKGNSIVLWVLLALTVITLALGAIGWGIFSESAFWFIPLMLLAGGAVFAVLSVVQIIRSGKLKKMYISAKSEHENILLGYKCSSADEIRALLEKHVDLCRARDTAFTDREEAQDELNAEKDRQAAADASMLNDLDFSEGGDSGDLVRRLRDAENELRRIREESAALEGRKTALGDRSAIEADIGKLKAEHAALTFEYDALFLAAETLRRAGTEIQSRMTPMLSRRTAEIFSALTDGRYDSVALDRQLSAVARLNGEPVARDTAFLSVGALDQLYLAVRLAICELALPEDKPCPVILDDALVNFDDERCLTALRLLEKMSENRQIILFTCHEREARLLGRTDI